MDGQELEVKYYIQDKERVQHALLEAGAELIKPRIHEVNIKFDNRDRSLSNKERILRLRQDTEVHLTYKGPGETADGVFAREEIELTVDDFQTACRILKALGYQELMTYEKYRTVYAHRAILVTVDELPIGDFVEIEAPSAEDIFYMSDLLGLDWGKRILDSYTSLFDRLCARRGFVLRDLVFENLRGKRVTARDLGIRVADLPDPQD